MTLSNSRFTDRLNTNYVPSDCEVLEIRTLLVDPTEEIARIDAQIAEMESSLVQLRKKRGLLQQPIDAHRALISPMRLIPQDILQEIFLLCLPSKHNALIDPNEAPLLLGRISRHWRDVAYSTPMLWSSIHIPALDYGHAPPNLLLRLEKIVAVWLERSASCALSVSLYDFVNRVDYNPNLEEHPLVLQLVAVSRRLRNLGLAADTEHLRPLLQLGPEDLPLLRRIHMQTPSNQRPSTNLLQTPTLRDLKLSVFGIEDLLTLPLPWSQLTTLHLDSNGRRTEHGRQGGVDLDGALDVLRQCSNIEQCEIRVTKRSEFSGSAQNQPPIIVPRLHTLVISGRILLFQTWIADLVAPNLRSLRIGEEPTGTTPPNQECLSVDIASNRFTSTSILELLRSFPMISHFRVLSNAYFPPEWLRDEFLELVSPPHNLCPILTDVNISVANATFSDAAILAFIKARMAMPTPLRRFQAYFHRAMELDIMPELQPFISDGLQVALKYTPPHWAFKARNGLDGLLPFLLIQ